MTELNPANLLHGMLFEPKEDALEPATTILDEEIVDFNQLFTEGTA